MSAEVCGGLASVWNPYVTIECASCAVAKLRSLETWPVENQVLGITASLEAAQMKGYR